MTHSGKLSIVAGVMLLAIIASGAYYLWGMPTTVDERSETQILFSVGAYEEFLEETKKDKDPNSLYRQGMAAIKVGDFALAEDKLFQNLVIEQNNVTQAILKSLNLYNKDDPQGALSVLSNVKLKNPLEKSVVQLLNGVYLVDNGNFAKAENMLVSSQKADPTAPVTSYYLALAQNGAKKRVRSVQNMEKAAKLGYQGPDYNLVLAQGHYGVKQRARARSYYEKVVSAGDKQLDTLTRLAEATLRDDDLDEAVKTYQRLVSLYGEEIKPKFRLAELLVQQEDYAGATAIYDDLEKMVPEGQLVELRIEKLGLYHQQGLSKEKDALYKTIVANIGENNKQMLQFAQKLFAVDMIPQAGSYIESVLVKAPNNKQAKQLYAQYSIRDLLVKLRLQEGVDLAIEKILATFPNYAIGKNYAVLAFQQLEDEDALTRMTQELGWDQEGQKVLLMNIFYELHEGYTDQAAALIQEIDPEQVALEKILLLQWYVAAVRGNEEVQNGLVTSLSLRIPGLNEDLVDDVFAKEFKDWIAKFTDFYDVGLLESIASDE